MTNSSRAPDREARFTELYEATYADLIRFVRRRVHDTQAEDVVAEAFLVAWRRFGDVPPRLVDARAWLFGIARHTILNAHRSVRRREALAVRLAETALTSSSGGDADLVPRQVDLGAAWNRLSARHQEALSLTVLDGLAAPQAAAVVGITPVAFRLRLSRARRALRKHLVHDSQDSPDPQPAPLQSAMSERHSS
ncbi:RNA polymerase sigma factor [Flindersiella endophytica]